MTKVVKWAPSKSPHDLALQGTSRVDSRGGSKLAQGSRAAQVFEEHVVSDPKRLDLEAFLELHLYARLSQVCASGAEHSRIFFR